MTDHDAFERRLADALRSYAADAPTAIEAHVLAHAIATTYRPRSRIAVGVGPWARPVAVVAILVALLLAALVAAALMGSALRNLDDPTRPALLTDVDPTRPAPRTEINPIRPAPRTDVNPIRPALGIPAQLHGRWEASLPADQRFAPGGRYDLDFRSEVLLTGSDGTVFDELGGAVEVTPDEGRPDTFTARIVGPCGAGVYKVERRPVDRIRFALGADACTERVAILTATSWVFATSLAPTLGPFIAGETYDSGAFTEPFTFVMPAVDDSGDNQGLPGQFRYASQYVSAGGLRFGGVWWSMRILDDLPENSDLCTEASALMPDLPPTPQAIVEWFRSSGLAISEPVEVPVDGRVALRFDIGEVPTKPCAMGRLPPGGYYGYLTRAYAIPTGDDTILLVGGSDGVNYEAVKAAIEAFVRSMDFN